MDIITKLFTLLLHGEFTQCKMCTFQSHLKSLFSIL